MSNSEKNWASPSPLGFAALSMICLVFSVVLGKKVSDANVPLIFGIALSCGLAQIIAGIIDLRRGESIGGNLLVSFGCLFMVLPGITFLLVSLKIGSLVPLFGYVNILLGVFLGIYMIPLVKSPWVMFLIGPLGFLVLVITGLSSIGLPALEPYASVGFFILMIWGLYMMASTLGEAVDIRIPLGNPIVTSKKQS